MKKLHLLAIKMPLLTILALSLFSCKAQSEVPETQGTGGANEIANPSNEGTVPGNGGTAPRREIGRTPQELGEEYPKMLRQAREKLANMPNDMIVKFPLGVNSPIRIGEAQASESGQSSQYEAIGFLNSSGKLKPLKPGELLAMFDRFSANNAAITPEAQEILVADVSGGFTLAQQVPAINVIVRETQTEEIYMVPKVRLIGFFRDALNAVLNEEIEESEVDVSQLDLRNIQRVNDRRVNDANPPRWL